jgi:hypothetical protein
LRSSTLDRFFGFTIGVFCAAADAAAPAARVALPRNERRDFVRSIPYPPKKGNFLAKFAKSAKGKKQKRILNDE